MKLCATRSAFIGNCNVISYYIGNAMAGDKQFREYARAWAEARINRPISEQPSADVLDKLITWELFKKDTKMQRTWKIEVTADFADETKYEAIKVAVQRAAVRLKATVAFGMDQGVKPLVVCYSDDFFGNHEDIDLWAKNLAATDDDALEQQEDINPALAAALADMQSK